jgi:hypothetical protein
MQFWWLQIALFLFGDNPLDRNLAELKEFSVRVKLVL